MTVEIDPNKVESLASQGLTAKQIAHCLGIGRTTLYNHKNKNVNIRDAIKRGRAKGLSDVSNALFECATDGNVTAQIFYLKNRSPEEWRDRREISGPDGKAIPIQANVTYVSVKND